MFSSEVQQQSKSDSNESLKLAIAMALFRSKLLHKPPPDNLPSQSDAQKWKIKVPLLSLTQTHSYVYKPNSVAHLFFYYTQAKERKQEILRLKQDLKEAEGLFHFIFVLFFFSLDM